MSFDEDPNMEPTAECQQCGETRQMSDKTLTEWEMQHFHFSDAEIEFLTCDKCKTLPPEEFLKTYSKGKAE